MTTSYLLEPNTPITCPKCAAEFLLSEGFAKKALETVEEASAEALAKVRAAERAQADRDARRLDQERAAAHEKALADVRRIAEESSKPQLLALQQQLAASQARNQEIEKREAALAEQERGIGKRVQEEAAAQAQTLLAGERDAFEKRLSEQASKVKALQDEQLALRQQRQALEDEKAAMALEVQRQVDAVSSERESKVRALEQERAALDKAELQKKLDDVQSQLGDAQRKIAQGSQQLQGEVLELAIEDDLRRAFPLDQIEEIKKGERRAFDGLTECQAVGANALPRMAGLGRERRQEAEGSGRGGDVIKHMLIRMGRVLCSQGRWRKLAKLTLPASVLENVSFS
jgi:hypothetical protein